MRDHRTDEALSDDVGVVLALTGVASAADMPVKAPLRPVIVTQIWAGPYIGINGGAVWNQLKTDTVNSRLPHL